MDNAIVLKSDNAKILMAGNFGKDKTSRLNKFVSFLDATGQAWYMPDLATYRDTLLDSLSPASAKVHLSTVRGHYKRLLASNDIRDYLYNLVSQRTDNVLERRAFVEETLTRLTNAINPIHSQVKTETKQDITDNEHLRLTVGQCESLIKQPGIKDLMGLRDTAIIALAIATGLRESELANLEVEDLRARLNNNLGVYVREGKGCKSRFVPYGNLEQVLTIVDLWLSNAGITAGKVFRSLNHHSKSVTNSITTRAIQKILGRYPLMIGGKQRTVKPHDLRRTYARLLYDSGMDIVAIQQNLGHSNLQTTLGYIGDLSIDKRMPGLVINFSVGV